MGNDGGSIPKRRELVKNAARAPTVSELKATLLESLGHAWEHCSLNGAHLDLGSVVSDWRGKLYNYESILNGLMPSDEPAETTPASLGIRSLRDVVKVRFSKNGEKWACPISMKEMGPGTKSVYLVPCGHAFAEVAMAEIQETTCPECGEDFSRDNIIAILPTLEKEVERLQKRIEDLRASGLAHTLKKDKSEKKKKRKGAELTGEENTNADDKGSKRGQTSQATKNVDSRISGINNPMAASLTAKVLAEQDERNKRRKIAQEVGSRRSEVTRG